MRRVGVDLEQFIVDPYGSGIQRVLQQLASLWPSDGPTADFVIPESGRYRILNPDEAARLLSIPFETDVGDAGRLRQRVHEFLRARDPHVVDFDEMVQGLDSWLLPEVTYLSSAHRRMREVGTRLPVTMIGYDALPMTQPQNYRFRPGSAADVSEYFRLLVDADAVVCISAFTRHTLIEVLGRDPARVTTIAHPGGDHALAGARTALGEPRSASQPPLFLRVGTLEARKSPVEITEAFRRMNMTGLIAELVMVGRPSASDEAVNAAVSRVVDEGVGVTWIQDAGDEEIHELMQQADAFLSFGTEGYGIPVLESLAVGTPVLFGGIQPAAELMVGYGAHRVLEAGDPDLAAAFKKWSDRDKLADLTNQIDQSRIPTWRDFVRGVVSVL